MSEITDITIKDLINVIHYTILHKEGESSMSMDATRKLDRLIRDGDLENYSVSNNEIWIDVIRLVEENKRKDIPHTYY